MKRSMQSAGTRAGDGEGVAAGFLAAWIGAGMAACLTAVSLAAAVAPVVAAESAAGDPSPKEIRELLDAASALLADGKPAKAVARVAEAAEGIEKLSRQERPPSGLRVLWERCRSLRDDLELEGVDVDAISLKPLSSGASKEKPSTPAKPATPARPAAASFTTQISPILSRHCGGCHIAGRKGGFQMVSYAGLMKTGMVQPGVGNASRLVEVIESGDMPRGGGKVSRDDLNLLIKWIDAGAPFDGTDPAQPLGGGGPPAATGTPTPPPPPVVAVKLKAGEVSFASDIAPVLLQNCAGCHDADDPESNFSMATLERLLRGGRGGAAVKSGGGADSLLVKKIRGTGIEGQRMPLGKPPLPDDVIALIQKWIDQGLKLDLLTPKDDLETVAAAGRAQHLSHADLRKVRFAAGGKLWSRAIPDEQAVVVERGDIVVIGNLSESRLADLADEAESVGRRLRDEIASADASPSDPIVKGGVVVYAFAKGYDFSSFWQSVLSEERPKGVTGGAGVSGDVVYAAVVPPGGDAGDAAADLRAMLTEQMTAAVLLTHRTPAWFAHAAGRALAMKAAPKSPLVQAWRHDLPSALQRVGSSADLFTGRGDRTVAAVVGGGFVSGLLTDGSRLRSLVQQLDGGAAFDQAFQTVFRGPPQKMLEAWAVKSQVKGQRR
jgi:mono/diheme cytochrome c family protein